MIAVILAAGESKRLRPLTASIPKCLLDVNGMSLLVRYLNLLEEAGIEKTIIVCGFNHTAVETVALGTKRKMQVECVINEQYARTHPIESLLLAEPMIDDDFLLLNSDIYFSTKALTTLASCPKSCIAIDSKASFIEDEMFVNHDESLHMTEISKSLTQRKQGQGKSLQIAKIVSRDAEKYFGRAHEIAGGEGVFYPTQAYDVLIDQRCFFVVDVCDEFSHELDTIQDYTSLVATLKNQHT